MTIRLELPATFWLEAACLVCLIGQVMGTLRWSWWVFGLIYGFGFIASVGSITRRIMLANEQQRSREFLRSMRAPRHES